jgi:hypothetical protein
MLQLSESAMGDEGDEVGADLLTIEEWEQLMDMYPTEEGEAQQEGRTDICINISKVRCP